MSTREYCETRRDVVAFSGRIHVGFAVIIWVMIQMGVDRVFLNPIPFLIGSVLPDCDHRHAPMGKILPLWLVFNHRGFTHTIPAVILFSAPIAYWNLKWGMLFAAGYLLHLLMDSSTPMGIKWWKGHKKRA